MSESTATVFHVEPDIGTDRPPANSILSQSLLHNPGLKVVRFVFAKGQELSEHTATVPALIHQVSGSSVWGLGTEKHEARPGDWAWMPANLKHSIQATEDSVVLLLILKHNPGVAA